MNETNRTTGCGDKPQDILRNSIPNDNVSGIFIRHFAETSHARVKTVFHRDDFYMLLVMIQGEMTMSIDFSEIKFCTGNAAVIQPFQVHAVTMVSEDVEAWMLGITPEHFSSREQEILTKFCIRNTLLRLSEIEIRDVGNLFEMTTRNGRHHSVIAALAASIKSIILAAVSDSKESSNDRRSEIVVRLRALIDNNLRQVKSPADYASMMNLSEGYLNEVVKSITGISLSQYIRQYVVINAKRMFVYTSKTAQEIAYDLGYDDYSYFSRIFKKETGISPNKFRQNLK